MTDKEREEIIFLMGEVLSDIQYIGEVPLTDKCYPLMDNAEKLVEALKRALGIEKLEVHNDPIGFGAFEKLVRALGLFDEENRDGKAKIYNMSGERVDGRRTRKADKERKEKE